MLLRIQCQVLATAVNNCKIAIPKSITEAEAVHDAAVDLLNKIKGEVEPDIYSVNLKNLDATFTALLSWPSHAARFEIANRLERTTDQAIIQAWQIFCTELMEKFRAPFDEAASKYMAGDKTVVPALTELGKVRDILKLVTGSVKLRSDHFEVYSRVLTIPSEKTSMEKIPQVLGNPYSNVEGRYESAWFAAVTSLPGVRLEWHSPADQIALDAAMPNKTPEEIAAAA